MKLDGTTVTVGIAGVLIGGAIVMTTVTPAPPGTIRAAPSKCVVDVHVIKSGTTPDELVVDHEPVHMQGCTARLTWKVNGAWKFIDNKSIDTDPPTSNCTLSNSGKQLACSFTGLPTGINKYIIKVESTINALSKPTVAPLDPTMIND